MNWQDSVFIQVGPGYCQRRVRLRGKECGSGWFIWRNSSREKPINWLSFLKTLWTARGVLLVTLKPGMAAWPWWDSSLALALSYSPVKESLIRSGLGDDEKKDWCLGTRIKPWVRQAHLLRNACGSNLYRWKHSTWLNLDGHGYWAVIHELTTFLAHGVDWSGQRIATVPMLIWNCRTKNLLHVDPNSVSYSSWKIQSHGPSIQWFLQ